MKHGGRLALVLLAALACNPEPSAPQPAAAKPALKKQPPGPDDPTERANLLNFAHGATVVSRTGETTLSQSALSAIDGDLSSPWVLNAGDYPQSVTIALPARSRIERVGVATSAPQLIGISTIDFDASLDGVTFKPLARLTAERKGGPQLTNVAATEARFIRATLVNGGRSGNTFTLYALGSELEAPRAPSIAGCWTVNGAPATFAQRGAHAYGTIETSPPTHLDGGFDGRFFRLTWSRGASFGYAAMSASPDGRHFSAHQWHEEPIPLFYAESWFGERRDCTTSIDDRGEVTRVLLRRSGRAPLFGLAFDSNGNLIEPESVDTLASLRAFLLRNPGIQARLVAHDFRAATPEKSRAIANAQLASIERSLLRNGVPKGRLSFVAAASNEPREIPVTNAMRALYSSVDLEVRR